MKPQTEYQIEKMIEDILSRIDNKKLSKDFEIHNINESLEVFKLLKEYEKSENTEEYKEYGKIKTEWKLTLEDLENWFGVNKKELGTKNSAYLTHQSYIVNSLYINRELFNKKWRENGK